jgi:hypothetical protein
MSIVFRCALGSDQFNSFNAITFLLERVKLNSDGSRSNALRVTLLKAARIRHLQSKARSGLMAQLG